MAPIKGNLFHAYVWKVLFQQTIAAVIPEGNIFFILWLNRQFRPKLADSNETIYCTPIDKASKMWFNKGSDSFLLPSILELWRFFVKSVAPFSGKNKYTNIRRFSAIFCHKTRIFSLQKVKKIQLWVKWRHNIYLTKAKSGTLSLFIENTEI